MLTVNLLPIDIVEEALRARLIVRYRVYEHGKWRANGFWLFPLPVHEADLFERAYYAYPNAQVTLQANMFLPTKDSMWW